jgi:hypothetical protein
MKFNRKILFTFHENFFILFAYYNAYVFSSQKYLRLKKEHKHVQSQQKRIFIITG